MISKSAKISEYSKQQQHNVSIRRFWKTRKFMQCKLFYYFSSLDNQYREDKLGRKHINFPRTG